MSRDSTKYEEYLLFAEKLADKTRALILDLWQESDIGACLKDDNTPVTEVDLKAEKLARELISLEYPEHGIIGEEHSQHNPDSPYQWTVDPIDGTQNLINRIPTFGTLLGLRFNDEAIIGVIDHPVLNVRCSGGKGLGVKFNNSKISLEDLSSDSLSANDLVATNSIAVFGDNQKGRNIFNKVMSLHPHTRIYYDCYDQTLALTGGVAVVVEPNLKIWDLTPIEVLLKEVGGDLQYFNKQEDKGASTLYNAIFGKPKAVAAMKHHLSSLE